MLTLSYFERKFIKLCQQGYSTQDGELLVSLGSMAAPIINYHKDIVAAINISGLSVQMLHQDRIDNYISGT